MVLIVAKVVDDIQLAGEPRMAKLFLTTLHSIFTLETVSRGLGAMRCFIINTGKVVVFTVELMQMTSSEHYRNMFSFMNVGYKLMNH